MESWPSIIDSHKRRFEGGESKLFERVNDFFLGNAWARTTEGESEAALIKTSTNFVFPIVETATSVLVPPNPQVSANPRNKMDADKVQAIEGVVNWSLDSGKFRDELAVAIQHVVMFGRCPVKTTWDASRDMPISKWIDPRNYFFDRTAQRFEDVRYEIEATLLSRGDIAKKVKAGVYEQSSFADASPSRYPSWMLPKDQQDIDNLKNYQPWYLIYEVYDRETNKVLHILDGSDKPILEDEMVYRPYELLTFNYNGRDIGGISEIGLILSNQEEYNWTETFLLNILRFGIPHIYYDAAAGSSDDQQKKIMAPLGSRVPINVPSNKSLKDMFFSSPLPQYPPAANDMLAKKRDGISFVSALTDAQRAQTIGAKTATELAFIEGNIRNRLRPRQSKVDGLTERVAEKHLLLASKYMRREKVFKLTGSDVWQTVDPWTVDGVESGFNIVPYSPMETNKAVKVETLRNIQPLLTNNPHVDQRRLTEVLFDMLELPGDLLLPLEQVQAAAQAAQGGAPPAGALPSEPEPVSESVLPPKAAAFSDAVASPTRP